MDITEVIIRAITGNLAAIIYYGFLMAGSVVFGYALLRLSNPDVRVFEKERKLGASVVVGALIILFAFAIDYLIRPDGAVNVNGYTPIISAALFATMFLIFKVGFAFSNQPTTVNMTAETAQTAISEQGELKVPRDVVAEQKERKTIKETEINTLISDLFTEHEAQIAQTSAKTETQSRHRLYLKKKEQEKEQMPEEFSDVYTQTKETEKQQPRYLKHMAEKQPATQPKKQEEKPEDEFQDVFSQMKMPAAQKKEKETKQKEQKTTEEPTKELTINDLFGEKAQQPEATAKQDESHNLFAQLDNAAGKQPKTATVEVTATAIKNCPNCHNKSARIVFCPYCSSAMCANCSPKIEPTPDGFKYTCPKCGEETLVKKKS